MGDQDRRAEAWSYAWWLTGDEEAASAVVRDAAPRADAAADGGDDWLTALLQEVRAAVGPAATMCPASEVALLHDVHGLSLDEAATLAAVDAADARTELAHGRLEALTETVIEPSVHPERLGGLAVGNPSDVAHARQCPSCGHARELLDRGRVELRDLAGITVPWDPDDALARDAGDADAWDPDDADAWDGDEADDWDAADDDRWDPGEAVAWDPDHGPPWNPDDAVADDSRSAGASPGVRVFDAEALYDADEPLDDADAALSDADAALSDDDELLDAGAPLDAGVPLAGDPDPDADVRGAGRLLAVGLAVVALLLLVLWGVGGI